MAAPLFESEPLPLALSSWTGLYHMGAGTATQADPDHDHILIPNQSANSVVLQDFPFAVQVVTFPPS